MAKFLHEDGAKLIVTDVDALRCRQLADAYGAEVVAPEDIYSVPCDVFSPNAIGGVLHEESISHLKCQVVAGGANNQLRSAEDGRLLFERGILYAPDYVINSAAPYSVIGAGEFGFTHEEVMEKAQNVAESLHLIFELSQAQNRPTSVIADEIARRRADVLGHLKKYSPGHYGK